MPTKAHSENRRLAPSRALLAGCFIVALLTHLDQSEVAAQALLYDNTDHSWSLAHTGPKNVIWAGNEPGEWFVAQSFKLGAHNNVASVSIPMARGLSATATTASRSNSSLSSRISSGDSRTSTHCTSDAQ